ncbi:088L [Invertebrate iridescent virus Kaz2018]|nr:088L [Invertebrate iridescent virus Kaz2018]
MPRVLDADFVIQWLLLRQQLLLLLWEIHHQVLNLPELIHTDKILYLDLF